MKQHKYLVWFSLLLALVMGCAVPAHAAEPLFDGDASKLTGSNWMSGISGSRKLSDITLPGTYHSGTSNVYLDNQTTSLERASEYIVTQERTIPQQLTDGVRLIDLHVTSNKPTSGFWDDSKDFLWVCRNMTLAKKNLTFYAQNPNGSALTLRAALNYVRAFLNRNPTETVIVNICEEGGTPDTRFKLLRKTLDEYADIKTKDGRSLLYLTNSMPELREVRGRIVVCTPHPNLLGANPGMQLPTMQEAIDSRDNSSVGGVKARPCFGYASRTKDWSQELPDSASKHASYLSVLYTCVVPQTDAHSSNVDPNNNRPIKEMAALINDDLYGGSNPVFKAGRLCGWTFSEYMDAAKAKVAWQTNFPSNLKYHTIVYGSDQHSKKDYVTTKVLTGSELVLPECMLPVPNTAPLFGGWEVSGKTYKPGEKLPNRIIADVKVWAQYRTTNTWAALGDYLDGLKSGTQVSLTIDCDLTATTLDHVLHVPKGATVVLDLAGHTLNRNISSAVQADGSVLLVEGNLTLKNGTVMGGNTSGNGGGVLVREGATLALEDVMVRNNQATGMGGGVYVSPTTSKLKTNFSVAGSTRINEVNNVAAGAKSNVTLSQGSKIAVAKNLSAAASVSVTSADPVLAQSKSASVTKGSALASKATLKHFASDDERYAVANRSNDVYLVGWYTVKFDSKGGTPVSAQRVAGFMPVEKPKDPTMRGMPFDAVDKYKKYYKFMGWYKQGASTPYDFSKPVTSDLTLVAKWYVQAALHAGNNARFTAFPAAAADVQMVAPTKGAYSQTELNKLVAAGTVVRDLEFVLPPGGAFDVSQLKVETDEGYSFDGRWMYNAALRYMGIVPYEYRSFNNMRMPAEFFARITRNKVSITLDLNGGVGGVVWESSAFGTNTYDVLYGTTLSEREYSGLVRIARWKSKPQRANHRLRGDGYKAEWYLDKDCTAPFDRNVPIKVSQTLYLGWQLNTHTVAFVTQGGSEVAPQTVEYGKPATVPDAPTCAGKVFCGWYTISDAGPNDRQYDFATPVTGDLKLYARWIDAPKEYVVAFDAAGGSEVADQKVVEGSKATRPADPVREGYTLRGWQLDGVDYDFDKPVTRDLTLKASWDVATYTVTFDASEYYEGISYASPTPQNVKHGGRAKYRAALVYVSAGQGTWRWFEGWSLNGKPYEFSTPVTGNITLTARWHFRYLVSFVPSVSLPSGLRQQIVKAGELAEEPEIPAGYEVEGYFVDDGGLRPYDFTTPVTKHTEVIVQLRVVPEAGAGEAADGEAGAGDAQPGASEATDDGAAAGGNVAGDAGGAAADGAAADGAAADGAAAGDADGAAGEIDNGAASGATAGDVDGGRSQSIAGDAAGGNVEPGATEAADDACPVAGGAADGDAAAAEGDANERLVFAKLLSASGKERVPAGASAQSEAGEAASPNGDGPARGDAQTQYVTVAFEAQDGAEIDIQVIESGGLAERPADPTREGYAFVGWCTSPDGERAYDFSVPVTSDLALYAMWTPARRTVTFDANGGEVEPRTVEVDDDSSIEGLSPTPTREGFVFAGWELDGASFGLNTPVTSNITLVAQWAKVCTVRFAGHGGTTPDPLTVPAGVVIDEPHSSYDGHHTLEGWYTSPEFRDDQRWDFSREVEDDLTLHARWTAETHTVTFDADGGAPQPPVQTVAYGQLAAEPEPVDKVGSVFVGWYVEGGTGGGAGGGTAGGASGEGAAGDEKPFVFAEQPITSDIVLKARWEEAADTHSLCHVAFVDPGVVDDDEDDFVYDTQLVIAGERPSMPTSPEKDGWVFDGWYKDTGCVTPWDFETDVVTGDVRVYARWSDAKRTVTFDANGGTFLDAGDSSTLNVDVMFGDAVQPPAVAREGFVLAGWDFVLDDEEPAGQEAQVDDAPSVVAGPEAREAGLAPQRDEAHVSAAGPAATEAGLAAQAGDAPSAAAGPAATEAGQEAQGDDASSGGTESSTRFDFAWPVLSNITLRAAWDVATYEVRFVEVDGDGVAFVQNVAHGNKAVRPADPVRYEDDRTYIFQGWHVLEADDTLGEAYNFDAPVTGDLTLVGTWVETPTFKVAFDVNGGDVTTTPRAQAVEFLDVAGEPAVRPTRDGYAFAGWYERLNDVIELTDGEVEELVNEVPELAELICKDERGAWMIGYDFDDPVTYNVSLYALWDAAPHTVRFVIDGVEQDQLEQVVMHGDVAREPQGYGKFGYVFTGWYADEGFAQPYDFATPVASDLTLYAGHTIQSFTVAFDSRGGSEVPSQTVEFDQQAMRPEDPTFEGHAFLGWYELIEEGVQREDFAAYPEIQEVLEFWDGNAYLKYDFDNTEVQYDVVLYARWGEDGAQDDNGSDSEGAQTSDGGAGNNNRGANGGAAGGSSGGVSAGTAGTGTSSRAALPNTGDFADMGAAVAFGLGLAGVVACACARRRAS